MAVASDAVPIVSAANAAVRVFDISVFSRLLQGGKPLPSPGPYGPGPGREVTPVTRKR